MTDPVEDLLHGSCVSIQGRGVLILGPSGSGKSSLALRLMAIGAELVADDQVAVKRRGARIIASAPPGLPPMIEARGVGLLHAKLLPEAPLELVVDLSVAETHRLPPKRRIGLLGVSLDIVHGSISDHLASAVRHYVVSGRSD